MKRALALAETELNTTDWLLSSYLIHDTLYSMLCVLILEMESNVIQLYMSELVSEEIKTTHNHNDCNSWFQRIHFTFQYIFKSTIITCLVIKYAACMWVCTDFISNTQ